MFESALVDGGAFADTQSFPGSALRLDATPRQRMLATMRRNRPPHDFLHRHERCSVWFRMRFASSVRSVGVILLLGACSGEDESNAEMPPATTSSPGSTAPSPTGTPASSGTTFAPLKGAAKQAADSVQASADTAFAAACECSGLGMTGPCADGIFSWAGVQLSECYYAALDADAAAIENIKVCMESTAAMVREQYAGQTDCGQAGVSFAQLQLGTALQTCALIEPSLTSKLNECDGAPTQ
jgi:hypothetical protein